MTNIQALSRLCNAIANTFYPDHSVMEFALFKASINAEDDATPKDVALFRVAVSLVRGYVETSRSENSVSTSVDEDALKQSLAYWCNEYGVDADDVLSDELRVIRDGSNLW